MSTTLSSVIQTLGESFFHDLDLEKILVTVRHPDTSEIAQFERTRNTPNLRLSQGYAMVSEAIRVRGSRTPIGQIELHAASSPLRAKDLMAVSQAFHERIQRTIDSLRAAPRAAA